MKTYIGIDPGKSGGIAAINFDGDGNIATWKTPETERDLWNIIGNAGLLLHPAFAIIEKVGATPQMGVVSAFTFGRSLGTLRGMLIAAGIPFEAVAPSVWQRNLGCLSKGDKNVTKAKAQELFPSVKVTHANSDALLIAEFCRRTRI